MKRCALIVSVLLLPLAAGCNGNRKTTTNSGTSPVTSGTGSVTSGTGSVTSGTGSVTSGSGTGSTNPGSTPGTTPTVGGRGVFLDGSALLPTSSTDDWTVAAGDVDGDGDNDLVFGTNAGGLRLVRNGALGLTTASTAFPALSLDITDVHLVDMDRDGDLDLVVAVNYVPVQVYLNDGSGTFSLGGSYPASNPCITYKVAVGDVNGDTYPDVYMANAGQSTATAGADVLLLNDQQGGLVEAQNALPGLTDDSLGAAMADVDNDGDLDVFVANFATPHVLLLNDGTGHFTDASANLPNLGALGSTAVAAADLNQDGYVDFYVANEGLSVGGALPAGEQDSYLINDGTGRFNDASILVPTNADASFNVRLVDVNGDSYPDVLLANLRGVQRLYLNQSGMLTDATANYPSINQTPSSSMGVAVADMNGDRTLDVIYAQRGGSPWLLTNIPR